MCVAAGADRPRCEAGAPSLEMAKAHAGDRFVEIRQSGPIGGTMFARLMLRYLNLIKSPQLGAHPYNPRA